MNLTFSRRSWRHGRNWNGNCEGPSRRPRRTENPWLLYFRKPLKPWRTSSEVCFELKCVSVRVHGSTSYSTCIILPVGSTSCVITAFATVSRPIGDGGRGLRVAINRMVEKRGESCDSGGVSEEDERERASSRSSEESSDSVSSSCNK